MPALVYGSIHNGKLPTMRLPGGSYRFRRADLDEFERRCRDANSTSQTTGSDSGMIDFTLTGRMLERVEHEAFQLGRQSASKPKSGGTNG